MQSRGQRDADLRCAFNREDEDGTRFAYLVIQITVCVRFLAAFLTLCAFSAAQEQNARDEHQRDPSTVPVESKSDKEHYETGRSLEEQGRYEDAMREFQRAISIDAKNSVYYNNLAFCLKELRRYDEAIEIINQALSLDPKNSYAYRELGICYYGKQQLEKAIKALQQAVSLNPSDAASNRWLGYALYQSQKYDPATDALDEAIKLRPNDFNAHYWRGLSSLRAGRFEEASRSLGKAAELRPSDFNANFWCGMSLLRAHKFLEAIPSFEKAREIKPQDKVSRVELFTCYLATQQFQKGARIFPFFVAALGGALTVVYVVGFALLLPFSLPIRTTAVSRVAFFYRLAGTFLCRTKRILPIVRIVSTAWAERECVLRPDARCVADYRCGSNWFRTPTMGSAVSVALAVWNLENRSNIAVSLVPALFDERSIFTGLCTDHP
ncbi:MAG: hypothetical protein DME39_00800 [Verrucomicrobia bacterium]|nr:MAG: hypothetical protein DME39_00800 [Verrucomicrobiota bacterium]